MLEFFKRKPKEKLDCLGVYEIKPYHYFSSNMEYAGDILVHSTPAVKVYTRWNKGTIAIFTFVEDETNFSVSNYTYAALKEKIDSVIQEEHTSVIQLTIFKNQNEETIRLAKEKTINSKIEFNQAFVYDAKNVRLKYYRPVPDFYKLYQKYLDAIYFDLAVINLER